MYIDLNFTSKMNGDNKLVQVCVCVCASDE